MKRICVFCGSSPSSRPEYGAAAEEMAAELVRRNIGLVYGGGNLGLMGILADAVLRAGGEVQGALEHALQIEALHLPGFALAGLRRFRHVPFGVHKAVRCRSKEITHILGDEGSPRLVGCLRYCTC